MTTFSIEGSGGIVFGGEAQFQVIRHYAKSWLDDAKKEIATDGRDGRRREIVFAVGFAESYIFEWVRDDVLGDSPERLDEFFPVGERRGVSNKYREVPRRLLAARLLSELPTTGDAHSQAWDRLVGYRNAFIHALASRPEGNLGLTPPRPTGQELTTLIPGWAVDVAIEQVTRLHRAAKTEAPEWLRR